MNPRQKILFALATWPLISNASVPTCVQTREIIQWSASHYGGGITIDLNSRSFTESVPRVFVEKLDPRRLLFLESEVDGFKRIHQDAWPRMMKSGGCEAYVKWVDEFVPRAKDRMMKSIAAMEIRKSKSLLELTSQFAKTPLELANGLKGHVARLLDEATPALIGAYGGSSRSFVIDNLKQILAEETDTLAQDPLSLIAKAAVGAMDGYSTFLSDAEFLELHEDLAAQTTGVGVRLRKIPRGLLVEGLVTGAPAERTKKIKSGDIIVSVDGVSVIDLAFGESRRLFRGTPGSIVALEIIRKNHRSNERVSIARSPFAFTDEKISVARSSVDSSVLVADVPSFYAGTDPEVSSSASGDLRNSLVNELSKRIRPQAIVLDVRGNPGGYLEEAVQMAGLFLGGRPVVNVVEGETTKVLEPLGARALFSGPIVVLQDAESASAAEILAGALKDYERAIIVGSPASFGKGSVQRLFNLDTEATLPLPGVVKLTTSTFFTPLGHSPSNGGIRSDIVFNETRSTRHDGKSILNRPSQLDSSALARIRKDRARMQIIRTNLAELSRARGVVKKAPDPELAEAVSVAADWLAFERRESSETMSQSHRDVVGY